MVTIPNCWHLNIEYFSSILASLVSLTLSQVQTWNNCSFWSGCYRILIITARGTYIADLFHTWADRKEVKPCSGIDLSADKKYICYFDAILIFFSSHKIKLSTKVKADHYQYFILIFDCISKVSYSNVNFFVERSLFLLLINK